MAKGKSTSIYFDRESSSFVGLDDAVMVQLKETYPRVNIVAQLNAMKFWLTSPKGKNRKGNIGFILNWLNNATPDANPTLTEHLECMDESSPLYPLITEYLQELWKGKEHLLAMNMTKKRS